VSSSFDLGKIFVQFIQCLLLLVIEQLAYL